MVKHKFTAKIFLCSTFGFLLSFHTALNLLRKTFIRDFDRVSTLVVSATGRCNLNCVYCTHKIRKKGDISLGKFCRIVDEARNAGMTEVVLIGGEPFLHPNLPEMVSYCQKNDLKPSIYTNGTLLSPALAAELGKIKMLSIIFKFDSKCSYKNHVGSNIFRKVSNSIQLCKSNGIHTLVNITITKKNLSYLTDMLEEAFRLGAEPRIERYIPLKSDAANRNLEIDATEWHGALETFFASYAPHLRTSAKRLLAYSSVHQKIYGYSPYGCKGFSASITIRTDGKAVPCGLAPDELSVGNINVEPLSAILDKYYKQREIWRKIPKECKSCNEAETCRGGCKAYTYLKFKRFDKKDPSCNISVC